MVGPAESVTERLLCRRPASTAARDYRDLFMDPAVEAWLRPRPLKPFCDADLERLLSHDRSHWQQHGFGPWALTGREDGAFVGRAGLAWTKVEGEPMIELPWALRPEYHGRGLATEAAVAAIGAAREAGIERLISLTLIENTASRRVMEKAGLTLVGEVEHFGLAHVLYEIDLT